VTTDIRYKEKWGWYPIIYEIASGDLLKFEAVTKLKIYKALTFLAYKQDKFILEKERNGTGQ